MAGSVTARDEAAMGSLARVEVECAAINSGQLAALLEVLIGHAKRTTDGNVIIEALAACMGMASQIADNLDQIVAGSLNA
ncbi:MULTISPECIES: hypothetical protein [unclassified Sphingomonas]|uniref:hypothetical protein n=1 Tax=unclassified Sphingomonas TaxID=196159 RepID=UPI000AFC8AF5|nr:MULTISPECIES: hypothetical protein [unclassified Sphingomonas]MDY0966956.1 hypothetical protein [Sphingomonas sp. CFBP9021]